MPKKLEINKGDKFYDFTIIREIIKVKGIKKICRQFECKCICGNTRIVILGNLIRGRHKGCGCQMLIKRINSLTIHGMCGTRFYHIWEGILKRCTNPNRPEYKYYLGKGIKCEWNKFEEFKQDMYKAYLQHETKFGTKQTTIDRIDSDGNYSKENCRWATIKEQGRNRINVQLYNGKTISEWSDITGICNKKIYNRLHKLGWSIQKAITL